MVFVLGQSVLQGAQSSVFCFSAAGSQTHGGAMNLAVAQTTSILKKYDTVKFAFPFLFHCFFKYVL